MIIKSIDGKEFHCHDWDSIFHSHIRNQNPVENFAIGKEKEVLLKLLSNLNKNTFVDVGAHLGFWSIYMSSIFENVKSFEPNIETFNLLEQNTKNNKNIKLYNYALGDEETYVDISYHIGYNSNGESKYDQTQTHNSGMSRIIKNGSSVKCLKLDDLKLKNLDFLKLDCEGSELMVLKGATETITKYKPIICLETNGLEKTLFGIESSEIKMYLNSLNYKCVFSPEEDYGVTSNSIYIPIL